MLKRIHIENFKSLKDVTLDLQPVNLLIGPNNSGKSNLLKALEFFGESIQGNFISEKDGEKMFFLHESRNQNIIFKVTNLFEDILGQRHDNYLVNTGIYEKVGVNKEEFLWTSDNDESQYDDEKVIQHGNQKRLFELGERYASLLKNKDYHFAKMIIELSNNLLIYKPDPAKLIKPFPLIPNNETVNADASNLVAFLDIIRDKYRDNFEAIEKDLQKCIPEFSRIQLENVAATDDLIKLYGDKTFKRLGLYNAQQKITYWADELSEGTLYFLALLCIVHQPNPPKLLLLEEPEKGIHPRRIKEVIDFIFDLAREKDIQVIMTTHHPFVVNEFQDIPEAVFIFDKDKEGATQIKNLQNNVIEPSDKENDEKGLPHIKLTQDLAEHWVLGFMGGVPK